MTEETSDDTGGRRRADARERCLSHRIDPKPAMSMHLADIWESTARALPDAVAVIQGPRTVSWKDYETRAARFAGLLAAHGVGPTAKVGLFLYNSPEYLEAQFGSFKARAIPFNVNYRYLGDELIYLLDNADAEVLVYHASLAERVQEVVGRLPHLRLLVEVDDRDADASVGPLVTGAIGYENALAAAERAQSQERSADDHYMLYTGGTTGLPKGVLYEIGDLAKSFMASASGFYGLDPVTDARGALAAAVAMREQGRAPITFACPPLMHGAGMWMGAITPHLFGGTVVLATTPAFDGEDFVRTVDKHRTSVAIIVGDAYARPILDTLDRLRADGVHVDLSSLAILASSGAMLSDGSKRRLLDHMPHVMVADLLGSSEGSMGVRVLGNGQDPTTARFDLNPGVRVLRDNDTDVKAGSGEIGTVAVTGPMVPLGYYKDPERSARTFREIGGIRYSFPGDMATVDIDGSIHLLGRGNGCINSGGEKVFPEEVEEVLKTHPAVADCLVFGIDDERFGQRVVAVAQVLEKACAPEGDELIAHAKSRLSGYKAPKQVWFVDAVPRTPTGKADYGTARQLIVDSTKQ
jgi:3-oxocholest-4-en-26-oate---CoA ligase